MAESSASRCSAFGADRELDARVGAVEPAAEARDRRQRRELLQVRELALQVLGHLLDQQVAERNAAQPFLAVGDRVEDRVVGLRRFGDRRVDVEQRLDLRAHAARQRHLDEDQRLVAQLRVEEREAAPVAFQPAAQVAPALHRVHRLVLDQLLQHDRRGAPVDALQAQEAAVEPGAEQVQQVRVDRVPVPGAASGRAAAGGASRPAPRCRRAPC